MMPSPHPHPSSGEPARRLLAGCLLVLSSLAAHGLSSRPALAQSPDSTCRQERVASIPLQETGYYLTAVARLHGRALSMIVDTGSEGSLLTPEAIGKLHLTPEEGGGTIISGPDGHGHVVPTLELPALTLGQLTFMHPVLPLGTLPAFPAIQPPVLGLVGMDLLGRYDMDLDMPHHRLSLWAIHARSLLCHAPPFWPAGARKLAARRIQNRFFIPFTLDGREGLALIDSGARSQIISMAFVHKLGITDETLARDPGGASAGIGDREHPYHWHRFSALTLGGQSQIHPVLTVTPLHEQADMLLGADWLANHQLWLSAEKEGAVFLHETGKTGNGQKKVKK